MQARTVSCHGRHAHGQIRKLLRHTSHRQQVAPGTMRLYGRRAVRPALALCPW